VVALLGNVTQFLDLGLQSIAQLIEGGFGDWGASKHVTVDTTTGRESKPAIAGGWWWRRVK